MVSEKGTNIDLSEEQNGDASFPFLPDIQHAIIKLMIENEDFGRQCIFYLKPQYFGSFYLSWFVKFIKKFYEFYNKMPNELVIKNELLKFPEDSRLAYEIVLKKILNADISNSDYIQSQLTEFVRDALIRRKHTEAVDYYNSGDGESALGSLRSLVDEYNRIDFKKDDTFNFKNAFELFGRLSESLKNRMPIGMPPIDEALLGGIAKKQVLLFLGGTNSGKSVILVNCLVNMIKAGKKVLYIDLENDEDEVPTRIFSCYTGIHYNKLYRPRSSWDDYEVKLVNDAISVLNERAVIKMWHDYDVNIEELIAYVERKKTEFDYDVLVIDYAQLLHTKRRYDSSYAEHGQVYKMLSLLAIKNNIAVVTAAQGTRNAQIKQKKAKKMDTLLAGTDIADSFEVIRKAAVVITITRSEEHIRNNEIVFLLDKQRRGRTQIAVKFKTDFDCIRVFNSDMPHNIYGQDDIGELEEYAL